MTNLTEYMRRTFVLLTEEDDHDDHDHEHEEGGSTAVTAAKAAAIPVTFILLAGAALLPYALVKLRRARLVIALITCLAAGAMLGIGLMHMLPETRELWGEPADAHAAEDPADPDHAHEEEAGGHSHGFSWPECIVGIAVLALVAVEQVGLSVLTKRGAAHLAHCGHGHGAGGDHGHGHGNKAESSGTIAPVGANASAHSYNATSSAHASLDADAEGVEMTPTAAAAAVKSNSADDTAAACAAACDSATRCEEADCEQAPLPSAAGGAAADHHHHKHEHDEDGGAAADAAAPHSPVDSQSKLYIDAVVAACAMALHGLFNGLALGATPAGSAFWTLFGATIGHKILDGFAVGVPLFRARMPRLAIALCVCIVAASAPVGIAVGWGASSIGGDRVRAVLLALAAGSFLFVACFELLPAAFKGAEGALWLRLLLVAVGYVLVAIIANWA